MDWNPSFPDVLGNEFLITNQLLSRVWAGSPARVQRVWSTTSETVTGLALSATVNPTLRSDIRTVVDIVEEGRETTDLFTPVLLAPNRDVRRDTWVSNTGGTSNLWSTLDDDAVSWPGPAIGDWLEVKSGFQALEVGVDASAFAAGGALADARIGGVSVAAIYGANTGFRKLATELVIDGVAYQPGGGSLRDVHGFGAASQLQWGEFNPATGRPWTPADIARFGVSGGSKIRVWSVVASSSHWPRVFALALQVTCIPHENRAAVGVWRRPQVMANRLANVSTDALVTLPSGSDGWAKQANKSYLFVWRQASTPALYGPTIADDVRWNGVYQQLGVEGKPFGLVYPFTSTFDPPVSPPVLASDSSAHDANGRLVEAFGSKSRAVQAVVPKLASGISVDAQPYRLDLADIVRLRADQRVAQRMVPATSQTYVGVRFVIAPPTKASATLTVSVHQVSNGAQVGGSFTISATAVRAKPGIVGGPTRYVDGFFGSPVALTGGTAYEVRFTTTPVPDTTAELPWLLVVPDASLGPAAAFGGGSNGAVIGSQHLAHRTVTVTLLRQPDPPQSPSCAAVSVPITTMAAEATTVQHVQVSWAQPAVPLATSTFDRVQIERSLAGGDWAHVADVRSAAVTSWLDREVPRVTAARYRLRVVAKDGRISDWATTPGTASPTSPGSVLILTSNHRPDMELVHLVDPEATWPLLSTEGDQTVRIYGGDHQVVFTEREDRGVGLRAKITVSQIVATAPGGRARFDRLIALTRALDIPYVCVMDHLGTQIFGHVSVSDLASAQPQHRYTAGVEVIPTTSTPVPVDVSGAAQESQTLLASGTVSAVGTVSVAQQAQTMVGSS